MQYFMRQSSGSNSVEFALILTVLLLMIFCMVFFGWYLAIAHSLQQISADTGRYAMVGLTPAERSALVARWIDTDADGYVLIRPEMLTYSEVETDDSLTVTVRYDASYLPTPVLLTEALGLPDKIERSATVLLP